MFELKDGFPYYGRRNFQNLLNHLSWYKVWKLMNEVKPLHLIPGLNMVTVYQLSEYFDIPLRQIKNIENKYRLGDHLSRQFLSSEELGFLALSKQPVKFEGVKHWQYSFKDFSIHTAAAGSICYSPALAEKFLPYIQESEVCSEVICRIIKSVNPKDYELYGIDPLLRSLSEYEQEQEKLAKEAETRKAVEKVLADMKIEQPPVTIEFMVSI